jgi:hypothetical protein
MDKGGLGMDYQNRGGGEVYEPLSVQVVMFREWSRS